jgi:hypothetical protein
MKSMCRNAEPEAGPPRWATATPDSMDSADLLVAPSPSSVPALARGGRGRGGGLGRER